MCKTVPAFLSAVWLFQSACPAQSFDHFSWGAISNQISGMPFNVSLTANDMDGRAVSNFNGSVWLSGWTTSAPPALLISEVDTANGRVELLNPGTDYQDVSGWE